MNHSHSNGRRAGLREQLTVDGGRPALDRVLEALSRREDRRILYYLMEHEPAEFNELVDAVAAMRTDSSVAVAADVREEIELKLHHIRLPKLEDLGIIEYDHRSGTVRYRAPPTHFEEFIRLARELEEE